ncbi:unnamed protein product [Pocillopora meandrina]|uniref:Uncharacterized protein n=1 Tax=Pocillopora meandrina TaxID=46732 RepID=A0AAU9W7A6_9CNID|nr:unnamed protein product [Pocillopora meandrina]
MKLMLVILSFAVIGITTAMHMVDIKRDAPLKDPEMKRKIEDLIAESLTKLHKCLSDTKKLKQCFKDFHTDLNPPPAASSCENKFEGCYTKAIQHHNGMKCLKTFLRCLEENVSFE